jgi:hypothetical protein
MLLACGVVGIVLSVVLGRVVHGRTLEFSSGFGLALSAFLMFGGLLTRQINPR